MNLFRKKKPIQSIEAQPEQQAEVVVQEQLQEQEPVIEAVPVKSQKEIVEEIHETFYTEVERLLQDAKIMNSLETQKQQVIDRAARLKALGFSSTSEAKEAEEELKRISQLMLENNKKESLTQAIKYFTQKYPLYRFITQESVDRICNKYGLIQAPVDRYLGKVPEKNLIEMEKFKIAEDDQAWEFVERYMTEEFIPESRLGVTRMIEKELILRVGNEKNIRMECELRRQAESRNGGFDPFYSRFSSSRYYFTCPAATIICATKDEFNLAGLQINGVKAEVHVEYDPVVLCPVHYNNTKYYLIKTAWGLEAQDEEVLNPVQN